MVKNPEIASISLDGETLCLNFINTIHDRKEKPMRDYLKNPVDIVAWAEKAELLADKGGKRLEKALEDNPKKGRQFFVVAMDLRELLYQMFSTVTAGKKISPAHLSQFNVFLRDHFSHQILTALHDGYKESWDLPADSLKHITAPIIKDAYDLLLSDKLPRVKECPNCGWLFLDTTRNGKRRWCSMKNCGSNIKALEWYHRQKSEQAYFATDRSCKH
jgi:predicted RNA-binding Zn ribbon-like protein